MGGQVITAAMGVWYLCHTKALRLGKDDFKLRGKILAAYLPLGLCSFLAQISLVIAMAATNNMLVQYGAGSKYGADIPLTVLGIVMKVFQIIISITIGMSAGCRLPSKEKSLSMGAMATSAIGPAHATSPSCSP